MVFNRYMSSVRESLECSYKDLKKRWTENDYRRMLKVRKAPVALIYKSTVVLWNIKVCMNHGGQISTELKCAPRSLSEYLAPLIED